MLNRIKRSDDFKKGISFALSYLVGEIFRSEPTKQNEILLKKVIDFQKKYGYFEEKTK